MRSLNSRKGAESPKQLLMARVPYHAIAILNIVKAVELDPAVIRWQVKLLETDSSTVLGKVLQTVYGYKLEQAEHELDAANFVTDGTANSSSMVVAEDQVALLSTANAIIYDHLKNLNPPDMSGRALARSALITLEPLPPTPRYGGIAA